MEYTLENDDLVVQMEEKGAELSSLFSKRDGVELLWQGEGTSWKARSPILFPVVGGLPGGGYRLGGKYYPMGNHGFLKDRTFTLIQQSADRCSFAIESDDSSMALYPFKFSFQVDYTLAGSTLSVGFKVTNTGSIVLPFSVGAHPGFRCPHLASERFEDYYLEFEKLENVDRRFKRNGLLCGERGVFLRNSKRVFLDYELFDRGAVILEGFRSEWVQLGSRNHDRVIRVSFPGFPYLGIWTSKDRESFVCIEPWYGIDSSDNDGSRDFTEKEGLRFLPGGECFNCSYSIAVQ